MLLLLKPLLELVRLLSVGVFQLRSLLLLLLVRLHFVRIRLLLKLDSLQLLRQRLLLFNNASVFLLCLLKFRTYSVHLPTLRLVHSLFLSELLLELVDLAASELRLNGAALLFQGVFCFCFQFQQHIVFSLERGEVLLQLLVALLFSAERQQQRVFQSHCGLLLLLS